MLIMADAREWPDGARAKTAVVVFLQGEVMASTGVDDYD
jgi:hypothetical protein